MIVFAGIYFIIILILLGSMFMIDNKKVFNNIKMFQLAFFWIFTIIFVIIAIIKSTPLVLLLPIIIWVLSQFVYYKVERNIKEEQSKRKKEKIKYNKRKMFQLEKQIITNKKNKLKYDCIDIISKYTYISTIYKLEKLDECLYIIDNIKIQADINIAVRRCKKIIDELYELNRTAKERHNSQNTNANNKKKSNSTSYTYTVNGALSLLNLTANSTTDEIKSTYRKLAKMHHPDRGGNKDNFLKLNAAYETLKKHYNF